jgi:hypothetical protein
MSILIGRKKFSSFVIVVVIPLLSPLIINYIISASSDALGPGKIQELVQDNIAII